MKKILLIEDEKNLAHFIELELKHESYEVTVKYEVRKGLESALSEEWDIIMLDLMLPGLNGIEVCRRIRKTKQTPIIMLTARDGVMDKVMGLDSGADDYIPKPFAIESCWHGCVLCCDAVVLWRIPTRLSTMDWCSTARPAFWQKASRLLN